MKHPRDSSIMNKRVSSDVTGLGDQPAPGRTRTAALGFAFTSAIAVGALALLNSLASADAVISISPRAPHSAIGNGVCGPFDPDCRDHLQSILAALHVLPVTAEGGVVFGEAGANGAVRFSTKVLGLDQPSGDLSALIFDAIYLPAEGGFRVRFTLADTEVLFMCKDNHGNTVAPVATFLSDCTPGGAFAYVGGGAQLVQIQWDTATQRIAARWGEIHAVLNILGNANDEAYAGVSVDTVWYGHTPGTNGGSATIPRGNFGLTGMIRSNDNHWEVRGMAGIRPSLASLQDFSIEARTQALYHLLLSPTNMMTVGVDGQYQYNTVPANSMGEFVSDRNKHSAYFGAVLGFVFQ